MSARYHISRYEAVMFQIQKQIDALAGKEETNLRRLLEDTYRETYYRNIYEYEKGTGIGVDFSMLDQDEINLVVDKPWAADGKHFSERIWGDRRAELVQELNKSLRKMIVTGGNPVKLAPEIKKKFNVSERQAERLLRTEDAYFAEEATYNSYKECGTEEHEIIATLDYKTSEICQEMDGKHFPVEKKKTGVNYPPFHPNCRTTTAPYIDDPELTEGDTRIARDSKGKNYYVPANMTYKEWYESLDSEERAAFVKLKKQDRKKKKGVNSKKNAQGVRSTKNIKSVKDTKDAKNANDTKNTKGAKMPTNPTSRSNSFYIDVTQEYLDNATPGQGEIIIDKGYKLGKHGKEIKTAEWLRDTFGGDIRLLNESSSKGEKSPDSIWKEAFWEYKSACSINASDKRLQDSFKQIYANPGGVVLNLTTNEEFSMEELEKQLLNRFKRNSHVNNFDLVLHKNEELIKVLRYKK